MGLPKGRTNNMQGRPKGSVNKLGVSTKDWILSIIDNNRDQLEKDLKSLEPKERWQIAERLLQYIVPRQQAIQATVELDALTDEGIQRITTELLNSINDD